MAKERDTLSTAQKIEAGILLRQHLRRVGDSVDPKTGKGYWDYTDGMNDEKIANLVNGNVHGVAYIRRDVHGNYPPASLREQEQRGEDVAALQARIIALERWVTDMHGRYTSLIEDLASTSRISNLINYSVGPIPAATRQTLFPE